MKNPRLRRGIFIVASEVKVPGAALPPWYPFAWVRKGRASCPQASSCPTWRYKKLPCFGGAFLLLVSPATTGGSPRAPHPQQGFPRPILLSIPHRGGIFPGEIGNKLLFQKKIWQITGCGLHVHAKIRTHVRNENATAWRQSPRWGWGGGNPRSLGVFRACPFCMRS